MANPFDRFDAPPARALTGNPFDRFDAVPDDTMTTEQQKWAADRTAARGNIEKALNAMPGFAAMSILDPGGKSIISLPGRMAQGVGTRLYDSMHPQPKTPDENPAETARTTYDGLDVTSPFDAGSTAPTPAQRAQADQLFAHQMQTRGLTPEQKAHATELRNKHHGMNALDLPDDQFRQLLNRSGLGPEQQTELVRQRADRQVAKARADASKTTLGQIGMAADDTMRTVVNNGPFVGAWANDLEGATAGLMGGDREMETARQFAGDRERNRQYPGLTTIGGLGSALATGGIATNAWRSGAPRVAAAIGAPATRAVAMAVGGPAAAAPARAARAANWTDWTARRGQNLAYGGIYGANYGAGQTEGGLDDKLKGGAIGGLAGMAFAGALDTGLGTYQMGRRALSNVANPSNGAYSQVLDNMGGQTIDDLARSVEVGTSGAINGTREAALNILGQEMARTNNARTAIPATVRRLVNEHGMAQSTAQQHVRDLINTNRGSNLFFGEQPAVSTGNLATRQLRTATPENMLAAGEINQSGVPLIADTIANSGTGGAARAVRNAVVARQQGLRGDARDTFEGMLPNGTTLDDAEALVERATTAARADYDAAYNGPQNTPRLIAGMQVAMRNAMRRLGGRGGDHADALRRAVDEFYPQAVQAQGNQPATRTLLTNMRTVQDARTAVRGMIEAARRTGRDDIAGVLQPLYDDVTRAMSSANNRWRIANDRWADMKFQDRALEQAQAFAEKAGPAQRAALRDFGRAAPHVQDMTRIGYLQKLMDKLDNIGQTHDIAKLFETDGTFTIVRRLFGDQEAIEFARFVRNHKVATGSLNMTRGSQTAARGERIAAANAESNMVSNLENASAGGFRSQAVKMLTGWLAELRNRQLARIWATPMTNLPEVARHLHMLRQNQTRLARRVQGQRVAPLTSSRAGTAAAHVTNGLLGGPDRQNRR